MTYTVKDFQPGDIIGDFEILRRLKRGGQAVVYLARSRSGEDIAVSALLSQLEKMEKKGQQARFIEEHRICVLKVANPGWEDNLRDEWHYLARPEVKHDRLIKTFSEKFGGTLSTRRRGRKDFAEVDVTSEQGTSARLPYVSMAYEAGGSLDQVLKQQPNRTLSPSCAVSIAIQLGDVLHHLHTKAGLVHHDISPSNILLRNQLSPFRAVPPDVVLIDLAAADSPQNPRQRQIYGKKVYLPPERLLDPPTPVSYHIDIYSVGILLYELLSGQRPQQNTEDIQNPHTQLPAIREVNSAVSPELNDLVMQAAARNPEERKKHLPDMQHLVDRLKRVPEAQKPCQLRSPLTREAVMQLVPVIIAIVLLIGLLGSGAFWIPPILTPTPTATATLAPTPTATPSPTPTPTFTPTPTSIPPTSTPATSFAPEEISLLLMDGAMIALCSYG